MVFKLNFIEIEINEVHHGASVSEHLFIRRSASSVSNIKVYHSLVYSWQICSIKLVMVEEISSETETIYFLSLVEAS